MNRSVERAIDILDLISNRDEGLTLAEIAAMTGLPKTSAYDIVKALEKKRMVYRRDGRQGSYSIGYRAFAIGKTYSRTSHLLVNARSAVQELANTLGKTVLLGKDYEDRVFYVDKCEPPKPLVITPSPGDEEDLYSTAIGKVFLAFSELNGRQSRLSPQELERIRENGFAVSGDEPDALLYRIAAPIFNFEDMLSGAVEVISINHSSVCIQEEALLVARCARIISRNMGHGEPAAQPAE